ncbi:MAG: glycosyltransferase family 4 protein [Aeromicrobium sp.]
MLYLTWRDHGHPEAGGSEVFVDRTAQELTRLGHDVVVFSSGYDGAPRSSEHAGYSIVRAGHRYSVYFHALWFMLRHRKDFDAVIDVQNGVPFWSPLIFRVPVFNLTHHVHREQWSSFFSAPVARFGWFIESRVAPFVYRNSRYLTVSRASRDELVDLGVDADRIDIVHNGNDLPADFDRYRDIPRSAAPSIITVGRLVQHKRVEMSIDALREFRYSVPDLELHVLGDGHWLEPLRQHAVDAGVADRVHFHGFVDNAEKHELLASSWAMAMPSLKEGWGLTIVEAGLHGTPTVAFRAAGGTQESVLDNETGLLADSREEFFDGLMRLIADGDFRDKLGDHATKYARSFTWEESGRSVMRAITAATAER